MRIVHRLVPGVLVGSLLLAGAAGVLAAQTTPKAHWAAVGGQVSNLSGSTFTLTLNPKAAAAGKAAARTVQVTVAANAVERARAGTTGALANGDYAVVVGTRTQMSMTANRVLYSAKAFRTGRVAALIRARHTLNVLSHFTARGTVQSSAAGALVITTRAGKTLTFQIAATTRYRVNGQLVQTAPTLSSGESVIVRYTRNAATKQLIASAVIVRTA